MRIGAKNDKTDDQHLEVITPPSISPKLPFCNFC